MLQFSHPFPVPRRTFFYFSRVYFQYLIWHLRRYHHGRQPDGACCRLTGLASSHSITYVPSYRQSNDLSAQNSPHSFSEAWPSIPRVNQSPQTRSPDQPQTPKSPNPTLPRRNYRNDRNRRKPGHRKARGLSVPRSRPILGLSPRKEFKHLGGVVLWQRSGEIEYADQSTPRA